MKSDVTYTKRQMRIIELIRQAGGRMEYQALAYALYPPDEYPRAWRYCSHGGPPGCYMSLSAMLRRMKLPQAGGGSTRREVWLPRGLLSSEMQPQGECVITSDH